MTTELEFAVRVTGKNMYEIADALTKVAGDLLIARILQKGQEISGPELPPGLNIKTSKDEIK